MNRRRRREQQTLQAMMRLYCVRRHHGEALCMECSALARYAERRLERCVFGDAKPTCANCTVHCYKYGMRERMRAVMRWSGPRMLLRHPLLAVLHMIDGRRRAPSLRRPP